MQTASRSEINKARSIVTSLSFVLVVATMTSGCATPKHPQTLSVATAANMKTVAVLDEIHTPTSLDVPLVSGGGALFDAVGQSVRTTTFTTEVRTNLDFQCFAAETLRESFSAAVKNHPGWTLVASNEIAKADVAFLLEVVSMGVDSPPPFYKWDMKTPDGKPYRGLKPPLRPVVTISATLIAKPPVEIIRAEDELQVIDPANHPILYQRVESTAKGDKVPYHLSKEYSDSPEVFKDAFREAIHLVVQRIADSWNEKQASK